MRRLGDGSTWEGWKNDSEYWTLREIDPTADWHCNTYQRFIGGTMFIVVG